MYRRMHEVETQYLLDRIEDLRAAHDRRRGQGGSADSWIREDLRHIVIEVAQHVRAKLNVPRLEQDLARSSAVDLKALTDAVKLFRALPRPVLSLPFPDGSVLSWDEQLARLSSMLAMVQNPEQHEELGITLALSLLGDEAFSQLLMAIPEDSGVRGELQTLLTPKLGLVGDDAAMDFWGRLRAEVDSTRTIHLPVDPKVAAPGSLEHRSV